MLALPNYLQGHTLPLLL